MSRPAAVEQDALRAAVRRFLRNHTPISDTRLVVETELGFDRAAWLTLAGQLGLAGLPIAEEFGGAGAGPVELAVVMAELGRAQVPSPYVASIVLAATALIECGDDDVRKEWLPQLAAGELLATVAVSDENGTWNPDATGVTAVEWADGWLLSGQTAFVLDGEIAQLILVAARTERGTRLFAVESDAPGLHRAAMPTLDLTRRQSRIEFAHAPARLVAAEGAAGPGLAVTFNHACIALAAEQLGGAERCLEMALDYAKQRVAFGRPIGGFQAIKHKFAGLLVEIEFARSAVQHAVEAATEATGDLIIAASVAQAHCSQMFALVAAETIHIHGGIGFTWEHDAQLYFKRAQTSQLLLGDATFHRERVAAALLDQ